MMPDTVKGVLAKTLHIILHCRRDWQFAISVFLAAYFRVDSSFNLVKSFPWHLDYPTAAYNCTRSCNWMCHVNQSFEDMNTAIGTTVKWTPDLTTPLWTSYPRKLPDGSVGHGFTWHSRAVYWANPRNPDKPVLCQWGWNKYVWLHRKVPDWTIWVNMIYDWTVSGPKGLLWMDFKGKFFGYNKADRVQNWLTFDRDPTVGQMHMGPFVLMVFVAKLIWCTCGYIGAAILWHIYATRKARFGTVKYLFTLGSLRSRWSALVIMAASIAIYIYMMKRLILTLKNAVYATDKATKTNVYLTMFNITVALFTVLTETSPVTPRMIEHMDGEVELPMRWFIPSQISLSHVFATVLLPEGLLADIKKRHSVLEKNKAHISAGFAEKMSLEDLKRLRSFWQVKESWQGEGADMEQQGNLLPAPTVVGGDNPPAAPSTTAGGPTSSQSLHHRIEAMPEGTMKTVYTTALPAYEMLVKLIHQAMSLKEYLVLLSAWYVCTPLLLELALQRPDFDTKCKCSCTPGAETFQACYKRIMARVAANKPKVKNITTAGYVIILLGGLGTKMLMDLFSTGDAEFGSLLYVLRLELWKGSWKNRAILAIVFGLTFSSTLILILICIGQDPSVKGFWNIVPAIAEIIQMFNAGLILYAEIGYLTPHSVESVPDIKLPMYVFQPSDVILSQLMNVAMLTDDEIHQLRNDRSMARKLNVQPSFVKAMSMEQLLEIKDHLRAEDVIDASGSGERKSRSTRQSLAARAQRASRNSSARASTSTGRASVIGIGSAMVRSSRVFAGGDK